MPSQNEWIGRELGEYFVFEKVGLGSMAEVYKALQPSMDRLVAVKLISPSLSDDPHFVARFRREAKIAATLEHPHILPVIAFGEQDGTLYLVMRYVNGGTLHDLIQKGPMAPAVALRYVTEIGEALDYAHGLKVVHRDIKPKNVLLDAQGNPFIADFGLARLIGGGVITGSGTEMIGTPHYMSPEQARGHQSIDGRSDLYSLGIMLYQMLAGKVPFEADSTVGIVMKHIHEPVPDITRFNPELPPAVNAVVARALAKHPGDRYPTAHALTEALARALGGRVLSGPILARSPDDTARPGSLAHDLRRDVYRTTLNLRLRLMREQAAARLEAFGGLPRSQRRQVMWIAGGGLIMLALIAFSLRAAATRDLPEAASPQILAVAQTRLPAESPALTPSAVPSASPPGAVLAATREVTQALIVSDKDAMTLVYIPAGEFLLGAADSDPHAREDEKPQQITHLDAFWIDRTEVTVAQFQDFVNATGYVTDAEQGVEGAGEFAPPGGLVYGPETRFSRNATWRLPDGGGAPEALPQRPVVQVSWNDAKAYCEWAGRRLPTEAEWDKAARGADGRIYPWGDAFDGSLANFCDTNCGASWRASQYDDGFTRTANAGRLPGGASPYGVLDMSGNVWEWVSDFYDFRGYYRYPNLNPRGPADGAAHVLRGGSWFDTFDRVRASARWSAVPAGRNNLAGFRCAADAR